MSNEVEGMFADSFNFVRRDEREFLIESKPIIREGEAKVMWAAIVSEDGVRLNKFYGATEDAASDEALRFAKGYDR